MLDVFLYACTTTRNHSSSSCRLLRRWTRPQARGCPRRLYQKPEPLNHSSGRPTLSLSQPVHRTILQVSKQNRTSTVRNCIMLNQSQDHLPPKFFLRSPSVSTALALPPAVLPVPATASTGVLPASIQPAQPRSDLLLVRGPGTRSQPYDTLFFVDRISLSSQPIYLPVPLRRPIALTLAGSNLRSAELAIAASGYVPDGPQKHAGPPKHSNFSGGTCSYC